MPLSEGGDRVRTPLKQPPAKSTPPARLAASTAPPSARHPVGRRSQAETDLCARLPEDHSLMLRHGDDVMRAFEAGQLELTEIRLNRFWLLIRYHLGDARSALPKLLRQAPRSELDKKALVQLRADIEQFEKNFHTLLQTYAALSRPANAHLLDRFPFDLAVACRTLAHILRCEESLFLKPTPTPVARPARASIFRRLLGQKSR